MKITALYVYPIKALRGIPLETATIGAQGILHDRTFMLFRVDRDASEAQQDSHAQPTRLTKLQLDKFPQCSLFRQAIVDDEIVVRYDVPASPLAPAHPLQSTDLKVPLRPDLSTLERIDVNLHGSPAASYRMGGRHDEWFSACMGFETMLVYIGDGRRAVLGTLSPKAQQQPQQQQQEARGWLSSLTVWASATAAPDSPPGSTSEPDWLTFTDCAPLLVTTDASLREVARRLPDGTPVDMVKFRPNVVVDGEAAWTEDFWAGLRLGGLLVHLTANCGRCTSVNVDYAAGRPGDPAGEGAMLKSLMKDRRVDPGHKWSPIFGRYGFPDAAALAGAGGGVVRVSVGDGAEVTGRRSERTVFDWDM